MRIIFLFLCIVTLVSCNSSNNNSHNSTLYSNSNTSNNCDRPYNPYSEWGHYAWYERARDTGRACSGNSDSFINWCEEYYTQLEDYNNCIN